MSYFSCDLQLLSGCVKLKQGYTKAMGLINELNSRGLQMDSVIYGTLLAICASHKYCEEAEVYFQKMKDDGHNPNLFHYSSLLNAYSENANYGKAELLMKDLRSSGLTPNKVYFLVFALYLVPPSMLYDLLKSPILFVSFLCVSLYNSFFNSYGTCLCHRLDCLLLWISRNAK